MQKSMATLEDSSVVCFCGTKNTLDPEITFLGSYPSEIKIYDLCPHKNLHAVYLQMPRLRSNYDVLGRQVNKTTVIHLDHGILFS